MHLLGGLFPTLYYQTVIFTRFQMSLSIVRLWEDNIANTLLVDN